MNDYPNVFSPSCQTQKIHRISFIRFIDFLSFLVHISMKDNKFHETSNIKNPRPRKCT